MMWLLSQSKYLQQYLLGCVGLGYIRLPTSKRSIRLYIMVLLHLQSKGIIQVVFLRDY